MPRRLTLHTASILIEIGKHYLMDTVMIHGMCLPGTTLRNVQKLLQRLGESDLLISFKLTVSHAIDRGDKPRTIEKRIPAVHGITEFAALEVANLTGIEGLRVMRSTPAPHTLHHRRAGVQFRIAFDRSCKTSGLDLADWILESDTRSDLPDSVPANQRSVLYHACTVKKGDKETTVSVRPDLACLLTVPAGGGAFSRLGMLVEIDRSTEGSGQISRKISSYQALIDQRAFARYWPHVDAIRIFWVVPSRRRIDTIAEAVGTHPVGQRFRFLVEADRDTKNLITDPVWYTITGEQRAIYSP